MIDFDPGSSAHKAPIGVTNLVVMTFVISILGFVCYFAKVSVGAVVFGAFGLILGGYSMGFVRRHAESQRNLLILSGASILISVIAFMLGFIQLVE